MIFSNAPVKGRLYLTPKNTVAISYTYSPDILFLSAHIHDSILRIVTGEYQYSNDELEEFYNNYCISCTYSGGGQCNHVRQRGYYAVDEGCPAGNQLPQHELVSFPMSQVIFQHGMHLSSDRLFKLHEQEGTKAWLQGTKVVNRSIKLTQNIYSMSNVHNDRSICWGNTTIRPVSLLGLVELFINSKHNHDLCHLSRFKDNCRDLRREIQTMGCTVESREKLIATAADALYLIHFDENFLAYCNLLTAGFSPIEETNKIIIVPLTETTLSHEGNSYSGYLTPQDACKKQWFINRSGDLIGQMDDS